MIELRAAAAEYLALRRALGFKLTQAERILGSFISHLEQQGTVTITTQVALEWAAQPRQAQPWWWRQRLAVVRGFARYLQAFEPSTEVPPAGLIRSPVPHAIPHVFSDADVAALMQAAGRLEPPLRQATYQTLIGLLAVTGMRAGEAIALDAGDADLAQGLLVVRHAKFSKTRELVLHPTTTQSLACYHRSRQQHCPHPVSPAFFVSAAGARLAYPTVNRVFRRLAHTAGLPSRAGGRHPGLHDFRHSFAVRTVAGWHAAGLEAGPLLPALSTYLGHVEPADTYWYLTATPELLGRAAQRLERFLEARP
jgi:integrase/recombinase XerD